MLHRLALLIAASLTLLPVALRRIPREPRGSCEAEGRGRPPAHWIGCRGDPGEPRDLTGLERILLGRPVDLNRSGLEDLAAVPGIGPGLAGEVLRERDERGPFRSPDELRRVRGIGPVRMERARPWVAVEVP